MTRLLSVAALEVDARSARSRQRKVGASEIGVCRRRAGYSHHGVPVTDPEHVSSLPAVVGTWFHKGALDTMSRQWGTLIETTVEDDMLRGHVDAIELPNDWRERAGLPPIPDAPDVVEAEDLKTKRDVWMVDYVRNRGPKRSELYQIHLYASLLRRGQIGRLNGKALKAHERALILAVDEHPTLDGLPVETLRLRYVARTGEDSDSVEYVHEQAYDEEIAAEAWEWVDQVDKSESPDELPRDEDGPGLSVACDHCPWQTACWGEPTGVAPQAQLIVTDQDLAETLAAYDMARTDEKDAHDRKALARAKLDGTDPAVYTDGQADQGWKLGWSGGGTGEAKPDVGRMIHLFEVAGLDVPYLDPKPTAKTMRVTRWTLPDPPCGKPIGEAEYDADDGTTVRQDKPRGGWTVYGQSGDEVASFTAGGFIKAHPDWVDERPTCGLKKGHPSTTPCAESEDIRDLSDQGPSLSLVQGDG